VLAVSQLSNRYMRLADIVNHLIRNGRQIDVLLLQVYGGRSFVVEDIASSIGQRFGQRIVMTLHGGGIPSFMERFPQWTRRVFKRAHALVTPSAWMARALARHSLTARVIPNVIHLSDYDYRHRIALQPRMLWMRSFHDTYNPLMAVRTLAHLRQTFRDASLVMAGSDLGLQSDVRALTHELGVEDGVELPGFLDPAGKRREGNRADIFLNTNRIDNMPVTVVEAGAMGLPVVATNVGGIPDLLTDGETGLIVPDNDPAAMADAVRRLLRDHDLAARLSAAGRGLAARSSWSAVQPQWEATFADVLAQGARGGAAWQKVAM
jgi:glycosyltransferase involved in cell wall biosynthesis